MDLYSVLVFDTSGELIHRTENVIGGGNARHLAGCYAHTKFPVDQRPRMVTVVAAGASENDWEYMTRHESSL
jgi:hypothetical protein